MNGMNARKKPSPFCLCLFIGTAAAVILRLVLTGTMLEVPYGVYRHGAVLPTLYHVVLALFAVGLIAFGFLRRQEFNQKQLHNVSNLTVFTAGLSAFLMIAQTVSDFLWASKRGPLSALPILLALFGILSAVWLFLQIKRYHEPSPLNAWFSFAPMVWCALLMLDIYFDKTALLVSPNKILHQIALLSAMLAFLAEAYLAVGTDKPTLAIVCDSLAVFFLAVSSIPNLCMSASLSIGISDRFLRYAVELAMGLFFASRLIDRLVIKPAEEASSEEKENTL